MGIPRNFIVYPTINHIIVCRAHRLSQRWPFRSADRPDLEQAMRLHLIERWPRFNPERSTPEMFTEAALGNWELQQLRNAKRRLRHRYNVALPLCSVPESQLVSRSWRSADAQLEAQVLIRRCLRLLTINERELLRLVAERGEQFAADELSVTRHQVRQHLAQIREKCAGPNKNFQNPDRP